MEGTRNIETLAVGTKVGIGCAFIVIDADEAIVGAVGVASREAGLAAAFKGTESVLANTIVITTWPIITVVITITVGITIVITSKAFVDINTNSIITHGESIITSAKKTAGCVVADARVVVGGVAWVAGCTLVDIGTE